MIITKNWLKDWLDIGDKTLEDLVKTLNSIGLEVDKAYRIKAPDNIVLGYVKEKIKHENSDKLSICQVDVGDKILQIVCGAANVDAGQFVAVALEGAIMPNGMEIKATKLRGAESFGMLCSSTELGFPKINDGIMILDDSIGKLELGKALNSYELFNDCFIEVELTPNRGDCLSVYGVARDLAVAYGLNLKDQNTFKEPENTLGIGRILRLQSNQNLNSFFNYRAIELKNKVALNLSIKLRLAYIDTLKDNSIENLLNYATHSTGVLFTAYDFDKLKSANNDVLINIQKQENGESAVFCQNKLLSVGGIYQEDEFRINDHTKIVIIEANYTHPEIIAEAKENYKKINNEMFYKSFRGSEPKLNIGTDFLFKQMSAISNITLYSGSQQIAEHKESKVINFTSEDINQMIGKNIEKNLILKILKHIGFDITLVTEELINAKVPLHRPDIKNISDLCEEVVRIIGIDNIESKALEFFEKNRINQTYNNYKFLKDLRVRAVNNGYFESLHYVLDFKEELHNLGFKTTNLKLVNPITSELDTLRSTLINHLLNAASFNIKNSKKIVKLFENGMVFDEQNNELHKIAFLSCGYKDEAKIANKAKPELVNFYDFLLELKNIIGDFNLANSSYVFLSPYEQADIIKEGIKIGYVGRVHLKIENERDLFKTYVCELHLDLLKPEFKTAKIYSKFPAINRDLSLLIPKDYPYEKIKTCINTLNIKILEGFRIVDLYHDENLKEQFSLTVNFTFKDSEKTLEDNEVAVCMEQIINTLDKELGLKLR
ncbi:phenylalanine--tRNA ligase subunit beta [Campylobacter sp. CCS1377]|uniref:Phenylalanine--tRNA ligase beta subunit n=1 Tax=Campylobacter sp. CCS1377 TaxID=3158229 RepID=A0AAU7E4R6_9BACT|nr:phenylalanine--tRNA ligase subunit beta [Campylobacter jejuni]